MDMPELPLLKLAGNNMCFGCGKANEHGLKMKFSQEDTDTAKGEFMPNESHQGWPGYVHGGILITAMDEAIGWATHFKNVYAVTAQIEARLKSMARIGELLIVSASITKQTSRTLEVEAKITRKDDSLVAEASSVQFMIKPEKIGFPKSI
jgi:acyl-coenzyme A thioesterase PaaI-like protein